jgi:hypothetical protein
MALEGKPGSAASADNTADALGRSDNQSADSAGDNIRMVMEHRHAMHTRMDE